MCMIKALVHYGNKKIADSKGNVIYGSDKDNGSERHT